MRLLEKLLLTKPDDRFKTVWGYLRETVPIEVSNIAQYYFYDNPQEVWDLTKDFPNCAPPWPNAFFEWRIPPLINSEGNIRKQLGAGLRFGCLILSDKVKNRMASDDLSGVGKRFYEYARMHESKKQPWSKKDLDQEWDTMPEYLKQAITTKAIEIIRQYKGDEWACELCLFCELSLKGPWMTIDATIEGDGKINADERGDLPWQVGIPNEEGTIPDGWTEFSHIPMLATCFCHCKNVSVNDEPIEAKLAKAFQKRHHIPKIVYKTLVIDPMRKVLETEGGMERHHSLQQALHICRGHFKDYQERGLFGKLHGVYWWNMHTRGSLERGIIKKDYEITSGKE